MKKLLLKPICVSKKNLPATAFSALFQSDSHLSLSEQKPNVLEERAELFKKESGEGSGSKAKLAAKEELVTELKMELRKKVKTKPTKGVLFGCCSL